MENELYHYGKPGMRWGVQNGPPYPLYRQERFSSKADYDRIMSKKKRGSGSSDSSGGESEIRKELQKHGYTDSGKKGESITDRMKKLHSKIDEKKQESERAKRERDINSGKISINDMTDEELDRAINRVRKQNEYLRLVGRETPEEAKVRIKKEQSDSLTRAIVSDLKKSVVVPAVSGAAGYSLRRLVSTHTNLSKEAVEDIFAKVPGGSKKDKDEKKDKNKSNMVDMSDLLDKLTKASKSDNKPKNEKKEPEPKKQQEQKLVSKPEPKKDENKPKKQQSQKEKQNNKPNTISIDNIDSPEDLNKFLEQFKKRKKK